ncbi:hypothetical protein KVR01_000156 [Diaporthe batatas]|uniref:uncharacterized protein n=1 Tax=Diaporthe batatas TaxID=748121 RepID=UPI001D042D03|nr:uncharacterized protein KVR01_000156 [Diaporthe batatas]KAG8169411.1 hypothetical protein KVR01_000156 [Diaporthe batatas]
MAPDLSSKNISFIGGGNMAAAIISGLVSKGFDKQRIHVSEPWDVNRQKMADLGVKTTTSNLEAAAGADVLIVAVKPQVAKTVCQELAGADAWSAPGAELPLLVSIAAGITSDSLRKWSTTPSGAAPPVVRVMPNTPALVGEGASGLYAAGGGVSAEQKELVTALMSSVSKATEWVDKEELLDVVTGLSGSGPAYFFAIVEHLVASATRLGLSEEQATRLAKQTCFGAGKTMLESAETPAQLRRNVTSPNGTTQAALESFEASGLAGIVDKAVEAATRRGEELGRTLAEQ